MAAPCQLLLWKSSRRRALLRQPATRRAVLPRRASPATPPLVADAPRATSDFTVCNELGVKIAGQRFEHTFFHCVLNATSTLKASADTSGQQAERAFLERRRAFRPTIGGSGGDRW
ncbi:MAG: hypothetical protein ABGZ53_14800 [Fuerstiella sp.]